jgi:predicted negative regulator of RcsB-dependent stress response
MSDQSVFEKEFVDEREKNNIEGVLEQLNLPPAVIAFYKKHKRTIYVVLVTAIAIIVFWALYSSYRDKRIEQGGNQLYAAMKLPVEQQPEALAAVAESYASTAAQSWARIELAHALTSENKHSEALEVYEDVRTGLKQSSPLYPLLTLAIGQTHEALQNNQQAMAEYQILQSIDGYSGFGYEGVARIHEKEMEIGLALTAYEQYLGAMSSEEERFMGSIIREKIAQLKALP